MVDQVLPNQLRAFDDNGDPAGGALLYIYETGTTTPVTVYTDSALSIAHSSPIVADGDGYFSQIFYGGTTSLKAVIQDSAAVELQTIDPVMQIGLTGGVASLISFSPTASINSTNVQDAIEEVSAAGQTNVTNATTLVQTAGSSGTYTLTAASTITAYAAGQMFRCIANHTADGTTNTLNVDSLGAKTMKVYDSGSAGKRNLTNFDLASNDIFVACYDGTDFVCEVEVGTVATTTRKGPVEAGNLAEARAGTQSKWPDSQVLEEFVRGSGFSVSDLTNGGANDWGSFSWSGIPVNIKWIRLVAVELSLTSTSSFLVQLSTGGVFATSGYNSASGDPAIGATNGFIMRGGDAGLSQTAVMEIYKAPGENTWVSSHNIADGTSPVACAGSGRVTLGGVLDGIRITRTSTGNFDGSSAAWVIYG